jgi:chorismate mutase
VSESKIFTCRVVIDDCDRQIAELLALRSAAVATIAEKRQETGLKKRDREREQRVVDGVLARMRTSDGRYSEDTVRRIYQAIFDGCEDLQAAVPRAVDGRGQGGPRY